MLRKLHGISSEKCEVANSETLSLDNPVADNFEVVAINVKKARWIGSALGPFMFKAWK